MNDTKTPKMHKNCAEGEENIYFYKNNTKNSNMETNYLASIIGVILGTSSSGLVLQFSPQMIVILIPSIAVIMGVFMVVYQQLLNKIKENKHIIIGNMLSGISLFLASYMIFLGYVNDLNIFMIMNGLSFLLIFFSIFNGMNFYYGKKT